MHEGEPAIARGYLEESLSLSRENGDRDAAAATQLSLAMWQTRQGNLDAAKRLRQQAAKDYADIGNRHGEALATGGLADLLISSGRPGGRAGGVRTRADGATPQWPTSVGGS